jgi:hypothetical protein
MTFKIIFFQASGVYKTLSSIFPAGGNSAWRGWDETPHMASASREMQLHVSHLVLILQNSRMKTSISSITSYHKIHLDSFSLYFKQGNDQVI